MRPVPTLVLLIALGLGASGCLGGQPGRAEAVTIHSTWQAGELPPDSMETMREALADMGAGEPEDPGSLTALCRITMGNPSALVRAEALDAAWKLGARIPGETYRVDTVDSVAFNERALRLDRMLDGEEVGDGEDLDALIDWVGGFRFPPSRVALALDLAEAVSSRALVEQGAVGEAFQRHVGGSLRHALTLVTMYAADDKSAVVRQSAAAGARSMAPEAALVMLAGMMQREPEAQVVFEGIDSLWALRAALAPDDLRRLLEPLQLSHDVAVRQRAEDLAASLSRG